MDKWIYTKERRATEMATIGKICKILLFKSP